MAQTRPFHLHLVPCARVAVLEVVVARLRLAPLALLAAGMANSPSLARSMRHQGDKVCPRQAARPTVAACGPVVAAAGQGKLRLALRRKMVATAARPRLCSIPPRIPLAAARLAERLAGTDPTAAPRTTMLSAAMAVVVDPLRRLARQAMAAMAAILAVAGVVVVPEPQMPRALAEPAAMALSG